MQIGFPRFQNEQIHSKVQNQSKSHWHPKLKVFSLETILLPSDLNCIFSPYSFWKWRFFSGKNYESWFFQGSLLIASQKPSPPSTGSLCISLTSTCHRETQVWYRTWNDFAKVRRQVTEWPDGSGALTRAKWEHPELKSQEHSQWASWWDPKHPLNEGGQTARKEAGTVVQKQDSRPGQG